METVVIDPHGDLVLQVENESLLVSSKVLALVSPVFEAMLKPSFKEGIAFQMGKGEPLPIPLPEDDMEALTIFCKVAHHKFREITQPPDPSRLEKLAYILDKYQCTAAMAAHGALWLQRETEGISPDDLGRLLLFAYVLDLPKEFSNLSALVLNRHEGPFTTLPVLDNHPLIQNNLLGKGF